MEKFAYIEIKAILFGVDESIIGRLEIGNNYKIEKDTLINPVLKQQFDYTSLGLRRIYETAKLNEHLDVAILTKTIKKDLCKNTVDESYIFEIIETIEKEEKEYIDEKMRIIRLYNENGFNIKELLIDISVIENGEKSYSINSKIPFPDKILNDTAKLKILNSEEAVKINNFIRKTNLNFIEYKFNPELLSSACFLYDQSYYAPVETIRFMVCIIGLESLLVNSNTELSYRLSRNCAMLLSNDAKEYIELYKKIHELYNKRSKFVHTGVEKNLENIDIIMARNILRKTIFKIMEKNVSKEQLMQELDLKGYNI